MSEKGRLMKRYHRSLPCFKGSVDKPNRAGEVRRHRGYSALEYGGDGQRLVESLRRLRGIEGGPDGRQCRKARLRGCDDRAERGGDPSGFRKRHVESGNRVERFPVRGAFVREGGRVAESGAAADL